MINLIIRPVTSHVLRSIVGRPPNARKPSFSPLSLFANGEQGAWYDPSDTTTLFQDSAGTIPVTASGQPVGLMLDKSGRGHHATQPIAGSRPIYRRGDSRGVVNLLTWSEDFGNASWNAATNAAVASNVDTGIDGSITADRLTANTDAAGQRRERSILVSPGTEKKFTVYIKSGTQNTGQAKINVSGSSTYELLVTPTAGLTRYTITVPLSDTASTIILRVYPSSRGGALGDNIIVWGAQLNIGSTALDYQRNDSHLGGVATGASTDLHWLETDGVDDFLATGNIDFTGTDKVSVFAGVRKLSDAAHGSVWELGQSGGTSNPGAGVVSLSTAKVEYNLLGTSRRTASTPAVPSVAPWTFISSVAFDLGAAQGAGETPTTRLNGVAVATSIDPAFNNAGTGNFGNYPLYLFRRGGTSLPFNGWFYGMAITGRLTTDAETVATERFLAAKSAVVIP